MSVRRSSRFSFWSPEWVGVLLAASVWLASWGAFCHAQGSAGARPTPAQYLELTATDRANAWVVFAAPGCEDCHWLRTEFIGELEQLSGMAFPPVYVVNLDTSEGYGLLVQLEAALGVENRGAFPVLLAGDHLYHGREAIGRGREVLIDGVIAGRGHDLALPVLAKHAALLQTDLGAGTPDGLVTSTLNRLTGPEGVQDATVLYFETAGCQRCARVEKQVRFVLESGPGITVAKVPGMTAAGARLQAAAAARLGLPPEDQLRRPMLISGSAALHGDALTDAAIQRLLQEAPAEPFWQTWDEATALAAADASLRRLASRLGVSGIILAGLVDGINPCAFAVIAFLVSYLTLSRKMNRRQGLLYGLFFCAGVFTCYLLIGLGFSKLLDLLRQWMWLNQAILFGSAAICLVFALGAAYDVIQARRHGIDAMKFGMPKRFHGLVHRLIRDNVGAGVLTVAAFGVGLVVSSIELVCTGQMYLPVIAFINSTSGGARGVGMLLVYNLAFIAPLLAVLFLGVYGVGSKQLTAWGRRHGVLARALTGAVILGLGVALLILAIRAG